MKERHSNAFTLLEVMIAIAVFALSAIALGTAYVGVLQSYEAVSKGEYRDEEAAFARTQLLALAEREKVEEGGEFETAERGRVKWTAEIEETNLPDLFAVTLHCRIEAAGGTRETEQHFRLLRPTWAEPATNDPLRQELRERIEELNTAGGAQ